MSAVEPHSREAGHTLEASSTPEKNSAVLTDSITRGIYPGATFSLGLIVGSLQGDLLLTVTFRDGEVVRERLDTSGMLAQWIGEVVHSKQMRDHFPIKNNEVTHHD